MTHRKSRIAEAFDAQAAAYDTVAPVQAEIARRLAARIKARTPAPRRILEIGCGTGLLSTHLAAAFPESELILTDIAPAMLERCRARLGGHPTYHLLDGEHPDPLPGSFDLIASSLAFQWFSDLGGALARLGQKLAPNGRLHFATLGNETFKEWRTAHAALALPCGTPIYPGAETFPWPENFPHSLEAEFLLQPYASGRDFARSLKTLGAREPAPGYRPLSPGAMRRLLASLEGGFEATYHVIYGEVRR